MMYDALSKETVMMKKKANRFIVLNQIKAAFWAFLIGLIFVASTAVAEEKNLFKSLRINQFVDPVEPADFSLISTGGKTVKLSDFKGKVVFLNFWTTWWPQCQAERPALQALYEKYRSEDFVILGITLEKGEMETIQSDIKRLKITFPNLHDSTYETARKYQVAGVPTTFIIDVKGKAIGVAVGRRLWMSENSQKLVRKLMAERK